MSEYFDRLLGQLHGLPDVVATRPTTIRVSDLVSSQTYIVQTYRQNEVGDTVFLENVAQGPALRLVIPPRVADCIARQRDQLGALNRRKAARKLAEERKLRGEVPAIVKYRQQIADGSYVAAPKPEKKTRRARRRVRP
jgi:hypothetical protein